MIRAAVAPGHAPGMTVVAQGVETAEERRVRIAEGCDGLQGYLFGGPEALDQAAETPAMIAA